MGSMTRRDLLQRSTCALLNIGLPTQLAASDTSADWESLFDGRSLRGWHSYQRRDVDSKWRVENGLLTTDGGGGDLVTDRAFTDFELELEWKIAEGGNSGIFYRVDESAPLIWQGAVEMQILDNARAEDRKDARHRAGAVYDLYPPTIDVTHPAGEFNTARIVATGTKVAHWLNGQRVAQYDTASEDWRKWVATSKFAKYRLFGTSPTGRVGLQDHGDRVWFRNIRVRADTGARSG